MVETRTEAICRAILGELRRRRTLIDDEPDLVSITVSVRLQDGPQMIRAVHVEEQRLVGRRRPDFPGRPT